MKKCILLCMVFFILFTSCQSKNTVVSMLKDNEIQNSMQSEEQDKDSEKPDDELIEDQFGIRSVTLSSKGGLSEYKITYPIITDLEGSTMVNVSRMLYEAAIPQPYGSSNFLDFFEFSELNGHIKISYKITYMSDDLISVLFSGDLSQGSSYADYDKGITIDIKNEKALSLNEFYSLPEIQTIIDRFVETDKSSFSDDSFTKEEIKILKPILLNDFKDYDALSRTDNFYVRDGKICLIGSPYPSTRQNTLIEFEVGSTPIKIHCNNKTTVN